MKCLPIYVQCKQLKMFESAGVNRGVSSPLPSALALLILVKKVPEQALDQIPLYLGLITPIRVLVHVQTGVDLLSRKVTVFPLYGLEHL